MNVELRATVLEVHPALRGWKGTVVDEDGRHILVSCGVELKLGPGDDVKFPYSLPLREPGPGLPIEITFNSAGLFSNGALADLDRVASDDHSATPTPSTAKDPIPEIVNRDGESRDPDLRWAMDVVRQPGLGRLADMVLVKGRIETYRPAQSQASLKAAAEAAIPYAAKKMPARDEAAIIRHRQEGMAPGFVARRTIAYVTGDDPTATGVTDFHTLSAQAPSLHPKAVVPPRARARIAYLHEFGHAFERALGFGATTQGRECFADAFALVAYVARTGDEEAAWTHAAHRALALHSPLDTLHLTGSAAAAAVKAGAALRDRHAGRDVPVGRMLVMARKVAYAAAFEHPDIAAKVHEFKRGMAGLDPEWRALHTGVVAPLAARVVEEIPGLNQADRTRLVRLAIGAASAAERHCWTDQKVASSPVIARKAAEVRLKDMQATASYLSSIGLGHLCYLSVAQGRAELPASLMSSVRNSHSDGKGRLGRLLSWLPSRRAEAAAGEKWGKQFDRRLARLQDTAIVHTRAACENTADTAAQVVALRDDAQGGRIQTPFGTPVLDRVRGLARALDAISRLGASPSSDPGRDAARLARARLETQRLASSIRAEAASWAEANALLGGSVRLKLLIEQAARGDLPAQRMQADWRLAARDARFLAEAARPVRVALALHEGWLARTPFGRQLDWSDRKLDGLDLRDANLSRAILDRTTWVGTAVDEADLSHALIRGADAREASGIPASIRDATTDERTFLSLAWTGGSGEGKDVSPDPAPEAAPGRKGPP